MDLFVCILILMLNRYHFGYFNDRCMWFFDAVILRRINMLNVLSFYMKLFVCAQLEKVKNIWDSMRVSKLSGFHFRVFNSDGSENP